MKLAILLPGCVLLLATALLSQNMPVASVQVEGDVVDSLTGAPVVGATAAVYGPNSVTADPVTCDINGHFRIAGSAQWMSVQVTRPGYLMRNQSVAIKPGESVATVRIELTPQAVISGKVIDEDGFPVQESLETLHYGVDGSTERVELFRVGAGAASDDRGEFRITNLAAGRYYVRLNTSGHRLTSWDPRYAAQFYPGTLEPSDSGVIEVKAGQERKIEFHVAKQRGVIVAGRVAMADGTRLPPGLLMSLSGHSYFAVTAQVQGDGTFSFSQIPSGTYRLEAQIGNHPGDLALQEVQVGSTDVRNLELALHPVTPVDLTGTIVLEGNAHPGPYSIQIHARWASGTSVVSSEDGTFVIKGLLPGHYYVQASSASTNNNGFPRSMGRPASIRYGNQEAVKDGFEFDGTSNETLHIQMVIPPRTGLRVRLLDADGRPIESGGAVLLQGDDPANRFLAGIASDGAFNIGPLPPGKYHVYAVADAGDARLFDDPNYLHLHSGDFPAVQLAEQKGETITLRLPAK
jgi:hypothetical protein